MRGRVALLLVALVLAPGCFVREPPDEASAAWRPAADDVATARVAEPTPDASPAPPAGPGNASVPARDDASPAAPTPAAEPDPAASNASAAPGDAPQAAPAPPPGTPANRTDAAANATTQGNATHGNHTSANGTRNASGVVLRETRYDFSGAGAFLPRAASESFDVPEGYARLVVNLTFVRKGSSGLVDRDASVGLLPPGGLAPAGTAEARPGTTAKLEADAEPGEWTLQFDGMAPVEARIVVTAFT